MMIDDSQPPDLLFFFSDQHHGLYMGCAGNDEVETPHLDRLASDGVRFESTYTSCPLCVPARCSMLTAQLTSRLVPVGNSGSIQNDQATWLHSLAARGYETVLCGRMHLNGVDQRHGFAKRIHGDFTAPVPGVGGIGDLDPMAGTTGMGGCCGVVGGGDSLVLAFDRSVVQAAVDYLSQPHDTPQCIVVGTYGPHFPYVAPPDLFEKYRGKVSVPVSWDEAGNDENPMIDAKRQRKRVSLVSGKEEPVTTDLMLACRAAYLGMITEQDRLIGEVRGAWDRYLSDSDRKGLFVYSSDHGDTCGEHGIFGKQTFYEGSVSIPFIVAGDDVAPGVVHTPVSIMDIGPTLCEWAGAEAVPQADGRSLAKALPHADEPDAQPVLSEWVQPYEGQQVVGRMVRRGDWKLIHYRHPDLPDQLFDLDTDPDELHNQAATEAARLHELMTILETDWDPERIARRVVEKAAHLALIRQANHVSQPTTDPIDQWKVPPRYANLPETAI